MLLYSITNSITKNDWKKDLLIILLILLIVLILLILLIILIILSNTYFMWDFYSVEVY